MPTGDVHTQKEVGKRVHDAYSLEYHAIINTKWPSGVDERIMLKAAQECRDAAYELLEQEQSDEPRMAAMPADKRKIAHDYWGYVRTSLWNASTSIRNMQVRRDYISNLKKHAEEFRDMLDTVQKPDAQNYLARLAIAAQNTEAEISRARLNPSAESFSRLLKSKGITFDQLVEKYAHKEFSKKFSDLADEQKATVYAKIIDASGRSGKIADCLAHARGVAGIVTILFMLAAAAWDIVEADNPVEETIKNMWISGSALAAGFTAETLAGAVSTALAAELTETAAAAIGLIGGLLGGAIAAMGAAAAAEALFNILLDAFTLKIPAILKTRTSVPLIVPTRSPLSEYLSAKVTS